MEGGVDGDAEIDTALFAKVAQGLLSKVDDDKLTWLIKLIVKYVKRDGEPVGEGAFDDAFAGAYDTLYRVVAWVLKENFASVFQSTGIASFLEAVPGMAKDSMGHASKSASARKTQPVSRRSGRSGG
jgi:hypothetical protein